MTILEYHNCEKIGISHEPEVRKQFKTLNLAIEEAKQIVILNPKKAVFINWYVKEKGWCYQVLRNDKTKELEVRKYHYNKIKEDDKR